MGRGIGLVAVLLMGLAVRADAEDKAIGPMSTPLPLAKPEERKRAQEGLQIFHRLLKMAEKKEAQCMRAIGNEEFCRCIGTKLLSMDFVQYVELLAKTAEDVDKLPPEERKTVDVARKCRDLCLK